MNQLSSLKRILLYLTNLLVLLIFVGAAVSLWLWWQEDGGFEPVHVALAAALGLLWLVRGWLKQQLETAPGQVEKPPKELQLSPHIREKLLNRVETIWIEGVLQQSIHTEILKLTMSYRPEATGQRDWHLALKQKGETNQTVPPAHSLLDVFNRSGRNLLILGAPGSGKTTMLLQLAKTLIDTAYQDSSAPVPLVLNLSSWSQRRSWGSMELTDWLVEEVFIQYGVARDLTRAGVKQNRFLYLLDGLDEILDDQDRGNCIDAINEFIASQMVDIVVCSRTDEYEILYKQNVSDVRWGTLPYTSKSLVTKQLVMGTAVEILPLTVEQVDAYLSHEGLELQAVRATLTHDKALKEMAQAPLMLGLMTLAYRGLSKEELQPLADKEARRRHLFDRYVAQMFARRPLSDDGLYTQTQATGWLANLARGMVKHGQSIFYIEKLQPTWLENKRWYRLIVGLIAGLIGGLSFGLIAGLIGGLGARLIELAEELTWQTPSRQELQTAIKEGLIYGLIAGLIYGLIVGLLEGLGIGLLEGLHIALLIGLIYGPIGGLLFGLLLGLRKFVHLQEMTQRLRPNQGVQKSAWNSLRMGLLFGLLFGLIVGPLFGLIAGLLGELLEVLRLGLIFGLLGGLIGGLFVYGGLAVIQHYILRCLLARAGILPFPLRDRHLIAFLDAMHERILLRRVGGGWIFIHRSLLEYFASLAP